MLAPTRSSVLVVIAALGCGNVKSPGDASGVDAPSDGVVDAVDGSVDAALADWYVNQATGNDALAGTSPEAPFRTITKALMVASGSQRIVVAEGVYDTTNGETFPLSVPAGVSLLGDEANKGLAVQIVGAAVGPNNDRPSAVYLNAGATIAGFLISAPGTGEPEGIWVATADVTIRNNTLTGTTSGTAIYVHFGASGGLITDNVIRQNTIGFLFQANGARVENNLIRNNTYGVSIQGIGLPGGDFGGGPAGSSGGNTLACNSARDLDSNQAVTIAMANNFWDHVPPTIGTTSGVDIFSSGGATIDTSGAQLAASACP